MFSTSDLNLASTLVCMGFPVKETQRSSYRRVVFVFRRIASLDDLVTGYWQGKLLVEPQAHFQAIKALKHRIYDESE